MKYNKLELYNRLTRTAQKSPCQKLGFACALMKRDFLTIVTYNAPLKWSKFVCDDECVRFEIPSRTQSMIGACGHAEERAIWKAIEKYKTAQDSHLYVTGVHKPSNEPMIYNRTGFSCIRCATIMNYAKVKSINWWINGKTLVSQTPQEAYKSSIEFALGKTKTNY